jgi:hypothetical protein
VDDKLEVQQGTLALMVLKTPRTWQQTAAILARFFAPKASS